MSVSLSSYLFPLGQWAARSRVRLPSPEKVSVACGWAACILALTSLVAPGRAATIHVPGNYPTIQAGIYAAMPGDTVEVACGTYTENDIELVSGVTLRSSSGLADCVTIDGQAQGRVFFGRDIASTTVIAGVTVTGGMADGEWPDTMGGALFCEDGSPQVINCVFVQNSAEYGAAVAFLWDCSPQFASCVFRDNSTTAHGGAAAYWGTSAPSMSNCEFVSNSADAGGAIYLASFGAFALNACVFELNSADAGGAIYGVATAFHISHSRFTSNSAKRDGGAIYFYDDCTPVIEGCVLQDNAAGVNGGALFCWNSPTVTIRDSRILHNRAPSGVGGGIYFGVSDAALENTVLWDNVARFSGGAVYTHRSSCAINNITCVANDAPLGGAIYSRASSSISISASIIAFTIVGGAVGCDETTEVVVTCSDIVGNVGGNWVGCISDQAGLNGNFSLAPLFCDVAAGDFTLRSNSPCAPPGITGCGLVGALPVSCGPVSLEPTSWGSIKSLYR